MTASAATLKPGFSPIDLQNRSLSWKTGAIILGSLFLTLSSFIEVPMVPVPVTMQTFAVALSARSMAGGSAASRSSRG